MKFASRKRSRTVSQGVAGKENAKRSPKLPSIPEDQRIPTASNVFTRFVDRVRARSESKELASATARPAVDDFQSTRYEAFGESPFIKQPQDPNTTTSSASSVVSQWPTLSRPVLEATENDQPANAANNLEGTGTSHKIYYDPLSNSLREPNEPANQFGHAGARCSPMEYTRQYLIEKSLAERENRECRLPPPSKQYHWTSHWEAFLVLPRIPENVRNALFKSEKAAKPVKQPPDLGHVIMRKNTAQDCPRLSLQLGDPTSLFPSVMNLASWEQAQHSLPSVLYNNQQQPGLLAEQHAGLIPETYGSYVGGQHDTNIFATHNAVDALLDNAPRSFGANPTYAYAYGSQDVEPVLGKSYGRVVCW